jgi:hypothetical protein
MGKVKVKQAGAPNFFVRNVEKMVLGVVLLLFGVLVYTGYSLESLPSERTPDKLKKDAETAKTRVSDPKNWEGISSTIVVPTGFQKRLTLQEINSVAYELDKPFEPKNTPSGQPRKDPTLFPPEKVEAVAVTGPVAYFQQRNEKDPFDGLENSVHEVKKEPKPSASRRRQMGEGYPGGESYGESGGRSGYPGMGGGAGMSGMPGGSSMSGMAGMTGMPGMGGTGMPGEDPNAMGPAVFADPLNRTGFLAGAGAIAKSETCVAVKALVPWKKQWDEYEQKFMDARGYNPARDMPNFVSFTAERAEVPDDPNAPLEWAPLTHTFDQNEQWRTAGYAGFPQEIADPRYLHAYVLTMPVPPFINRDPVKLALHTDVPKMQPQVPKLLTEEERAAEEKKAKEKLKAKKAEAKASDVPRLPGQGMQGMPGMEGMSGMGMPGMAGMPGMEGGMSGMPGMPGGGMPGMGMPGMGMPGMGGMSGMPGMEGGMSGMPGMAYGGESGMGMMGGMGMGMSGMPGMEGMAGYDANGMMVRGPQIPHLMIRFFDFTAEVGKKYRYRVQVVMEDPNYPMDYRMEPTERYFDDEVKKRLAKIKAQDKANKTRTPWIRTDFSEPSEIVSVEVNPETHVGKIATGRFTPIKDAGPNLNFQVDEPTGKVMGVVWDAAKAVDVPGIVDGFRGTCLNFIAKADVIHPVTLVYKTLPDYEFLTDHIIADIRGGEEFQINDKEDPLATIGEYAYFDEQGRLKVRNELDDLENYKKLAMPEPPPAVAGAGMGGMEYGGAEAMGMPGMPGMEMGDPRQKRGKKKAPGP